MNINFQNNSLIQNIPQNSSASSVSTNANLIQSTGGQKAVIQFADNRLIQIAQNPITLSNNQQIPQTFFLQMPCNILNQNFLAPNQNVSDVSRMPSDNKMATSLPNASIFPNSNLINNTNNNVILNNALPNVVPTSDNNNTAQATPVASNPVNQINFINQNQMAFINNIQNNNLISIERYQELTEIFYKRNLLYKTPQVNETTVLVEFRLNNQKFQYRMTRSQKSEMESLLSSINDQQKQMEILHVYQAEQRKQMLQPQLQQSRSLILNQPRPTQPNPMGNKQQSAANHTPIGITPRSTPLICNSNSNPNNQMNNKLSNPNTNNKNLGGSVYPMNSLLVAVPPTTQQQNTNQPSHIPSNESKPMSNSNNINDSKTNSFQNNKQIQYNNHFISSLNASNGILLTPNTQSTNNSTTLNNQRISSNQSNLSVLSSSPLVKREKSLYSHQSFQQSIHSGSASSSTNKVPLYTSSNPSNQSLNNNCSVKNSPISSASSVSNNSDKPPRIRRFNNMRKILYEDYTSVLNPDYKRPFENDEDVVRRLLPYHILDESKDLNHSEVDKILSNSFSYLEKKCSNMKRIVSSIKIDEKIRDKNESLIIKRMRLDLEKDILEREKMSQSSCYGDRNFIPLLFDDKGNAYPSIKVEPKPDTESTSLQIKHETTESSSFNDKIQANDCGNRRKRKFNDDSKNYDDDSDYSDVKNDSMDDDKDDTSDVSSSDHTVPVVDEDRDDNVSSVSGDNTSFSRKINHDLPKTKVHKHSFNNSDNIYNIQDISVDSFDSTNILDPSTNWPSSSTNASLKQTSSKLSPLSSIKPESSVSRFYNEDKDEKDDNCENPLQSEDPDVDAAIKSILF